jgi:hypothetical protein
VGIGYVPFNEFPSMLHVGEAVLTRNEADAYRKEKAQEAKGKQSSGISATDVAAAVKGALKDMCVYFDNEKAGSILERPISNAQGAAVVAGRFG